MLELSDLGGQVSHQFLINFLKSHWVFRVVESHLCFREHPSNATMEAPDVAACQIYKEPRESVAVALRR